MTGDLCFLSIAEAAELIASRQLSPLELTDAFIARIERVDPIVRSYITFDAAKARRAAAAATAEIAAGRYRGPLHGIPYGLKDTIDAEGWPTTANSRLSNAADAAHDAIVTARLREAGAILLGKLHTYEYGTGTGADLAELPYPPARNPWDTSRFTGGSSTGSGAAVAAGTAMFAIGADTGGSVRLPAAGCGVVGLKPTYGRVSRVGMLPNCYSLDHIGPLARSAADAAIVLAAIAGFDAADPVSLPTVAIESTTAMPRRVGAIRRWHERDLACDLPVAAAFDAALAQLRALGTIVEEIDLSYAQQDFVTCMRIINGAESFSIHEREFRERRAQMGPALFDKFMGGALIPASAYVRAQRWRRAMNAALDQILVDQDVLVCPTTARVAPLLADGEAVAAFTSEAMTAPFSLSGHPAVALPMGFGDAGLPVSLQIVGRHGEDETALALAAAYEDATPWHRRRAPCAASGIAPPPRPPAAAIEPDGPGPTALARQLGLDLVDARDRAGFVRQKRRIDAMLARLPLDLPRDLDPAVLPRPPRT